MYPGRLIPGRAGHGQLPQRGALGSLRERVYPEISNVSIGRICPDSDQGCFSSDPKTRLLWKVDSIGKQRNMSGVLHLKTSLCPAWSALSLVAAWPGWPWWCHRPLPAPPSQPESVQAFRAQSPDKMDL